MEASIGVNLRVTAHSNQGGRKYMEDMFCVAYQPTADEKDLLYAYFGIFDGHGGREAALYAKTHLMDHIVSQKNFWSEDDDLVLRSIKDGFISVHQAMLKEYEGWPKTQSGLPSTSGTTASVAFVRRGKLYIGHVGDSGIVLGYQDPTTPYWKSKQLTIDHKPESPVEHARIVECGGKVISKSGVPRVVWNRPRLGHQGPVRRSTPIDEIPFLAVARSLGDLWSYNVEHKEFVVSPVPDTAVIEIDVNSHRCLILGSDGLWNMLSAQDAVNSVFFAEQNNERQSQLAGNDGVQAQKNWINPSKRLVDRALDRWYSNNLRADNTSVVTVVIDPPGPPRAPKSPSSRSSSSSVSPERSPSGSRVSCAQTNNHGMIPTSHFSRPIATTRFAKNDRHSPSRALSPSHQRNQQSQKPEPESSSPPLAKSSGTKSTATSGAAKLKSVVSVTAATRALRQPRDMPTRGTRAHPIVSSKTSRVMNVKRIPNSFTSPSTSGSNNQLTAASPLSTPLSPATHGNSESDPVNPSDDQVQINEISSSCEESWRNEPAELDDSVQVSSNENTASKKKQTRSKKAQPRTSSSAKDSSSSTSKGRKRASRQSAADPVEEEDDEGCIQVSPIKVSRLMAAASAKAEDGPSPPKKRNEKRPLRGNKLRSRAKGIRDSISPEKKNAVAALTPVTPTVDASPSLDKSKKKTKKQDVRNLVNPMNKIGSPNHTSELPTTCRVRSFTTTKPSSGVIQPIVPERSSDDDSHNLLFVVKKLADGTTIRKLRKVKNAGVDPANQKITRSSPSKVVALEPSRISTLRVHPARAAAAAAASSLSLVNTIPLRDVTLRNSKPALKRLQQGKNLSRSSPKDERSPSPKKRCTEERTSEVESNPETIPGPSPPKASSDKRTTRGSSNTVDISGELQTPTKKNVDIKSIGSPDITSGPTLVKANTEKRTTRGSSSSSNISEGLSAPTKKTIDPKSLSSPDITLAHISTKSPVAKRVTRGSSGSGDTSEESSSESGDEQPGRVTRSRNAKNLRDF